MSVFYYGAEETPKKEDAVAKEEPAPSPPPPAPVQPPTETSAVNVPVASDVDAALKLLKETSLNENEKTVNAALKMEEEIAGRIQTLAELANISSIDLVNPVQFQKYPVAYAEFKKDVKKTLPNLDDDRIPKLFEKVFTIEIPRGFFRKPWRDWQDNEYYYRTVRGRMHCAFRLDNFNREWAWLAGQEAEKIVLAPLNFFG